MHEEIDAYFSKMDYESVLCHFTTAQFVSEFCETQAAFNIFCRTAMHNGNALRLIYVMPLIILPLVALTARTCDREKGGCIHDNKTPHWYGHGASGK